MPRATGSTGEKWFICDQCGFDYPVKYLRRQRGLRVCSYLPCYDQPGGQSQGDDPRMISFVEPSGVPEAGDGTRAADEGTVRDPGYTPPS